MSELEVCRPGGQLTVAVAAMRVPALSPGPLRLLLRVALGERSRLALARTAGLLQQPLQLGDASVALDDERIPLCEMGGQLDDPSLERADPLGQPLCLLLPRPSPHEIVARSPLSAGSCLHDAITQVVDPLNKYARAMATLRRRAMSSLADPGA